MNDPAWQQTEIVTAEDGIGGDDEYVSSDYICDCGSDLPYEPGYDYCICCFFDTLVVEARQPAYPETGYPTLDEMAEAASDA